MLEATSVLLNTTSRTFDVAVRIDRSSALPRLTKQIVFLPGGRLEPSVARRKISLDLAILTWRRETWQPWVDAVWRAEMRQQAKQHELNERTNERTNDDSFSVINDKISLEAQLISDKKKCSFSSKNCQLKKPNFSVPGAEELSFFSAKKFDHFRLTCVLCNLAFNMNSRNSWISCFLILQCAILACVGQLQEDEVDPSGTRKHALHAQRQPLQGHAHHRRLPSRRSICFQISTWTEKRGKTYCILVIISNAKQRNEVRHTVL